MNDVGYFAKRAKGIKTISLAKGLRVNLSPSIINQLKLRIMKIFSSLLFSAMFILCVFLTITLSPAYIQDLTNISENATLTNIDIFLTIKTSLEVAAATFVMFCITAQVIVSPLALYAILKED